MDHSSAPDIADDKDTNINEQSRANSENEDVEMASSPKLNPKKLKVEPAAEEAPQVIPVKRKPGRPRKNPLAPHVASKPNKAITRDPSESETSSAQSSRNPSKLLKRNDERRDSNSESGSTTTPNDPDAIQLPDRKRPVCLSSINAQDRSGRTLIFKYSSRGDVETTTTLLKAGADLFIADHAGWTPLHEACLEGHAEIVELMLIHGADVNARGGDGDTPLHDAVGNGHVKVVQILLRYGASFEAVNEHGQTPLEFAQQLVKNEDDQAQNIVDLLKDWSKMVVKIIKKDSTGATHLHKICAKNLHERICKILWYGADVNAQDNSGLTPLHDACLNGAKESVETLVAFGAKMDVVSTEGETPLDDAVINGHPECVNILLQYGTNPKTALRKFEKLLKSGGGNFKSCKSLLEKPESFWRPYKTPEYHPRLIDTSKPVELRIKQTDRSEDPCAPPYPFAWGGLDNKAGPFESTREEKKFQALWKSLEKQDADDRRDDHSDSRVADPDRRRKGSALKAAKDESYV
jgi:ankyrin repeat protein